MFNMDIGQSVSPLNALLTSLVPLGLKILEALVIFVIGKKLIRFALKLLDGAAARAGLDVGLARFLSTVARIALYILLAFVIIGELGFNTASIIAVLGSAALAVGLSLQGSLANFAGSVLLVFTELTTGDNRRITIPNGSLANGPITNITAHSTRRVDLTVGISYSADLKKAKEVITETIQKNSYILKDQPIAVFVNSLGESDVVLACGGWVNTPDYLAAKRALTEEIKLAFDEAGVEIPFPQVDVHMKQE